MPTLLFSNLHMDAFLNVHGLTAKDVVRVHSVYIVWNAINDIAAGYCSDRIVDRCRMTRITYLKFLSIAWVLVSALPFLLNANFFSPLLQSSSTTSSATTT